MRRDEDEDELARKRRRERKTRGKKCWFKGKADETWLCVKKEGVFEVKERVKYKLGEFGVWISE